MSHLVLELILWMLFAFFVGCIIGCILHRLVGYGAVASRTSDTAMEKPAAAAAIESPANGEVEAPQPESAPAMAMEKPVPLAGKPERSKGKAATIAEPPAPAGKTARPKGIAAARSGKADNLQRISGVGPKNEKTLHRLGFFHFDQIAAWTSEEIAWVDDHLKFNGRILREEWTAQARLLADGKEDEFRELYGTGGVRNKKGEAESGTRNRKS